MDSSPDYEEATGFLKINKDLGWALGDELQEKCRNLVASRASSLILDLSPATHVCSANMVVFACAGALAVQNKRVLKVIVSKRAARSFELAGFKEFMELQVV
jgi:anti-anti-sigma regulatory factor